MTNEVKNVPELRFHGFTEEWKQKNIGDYIKELKMFETQQGSGFSIATSSRNGLFKQEDYFDGERTFSKNDVSYSVVPPNFITYRHMSDDNIFKFNINSFNENLLVSKEYPVFDVNNQADKKFVFYELNNNNNFLKFCIKQKKGGTRTRLYFKVLEKYKTFFPTILEQEKIGNFFSKLDQQIELEEQKLEKLEEQKKGYMQKVFSQELRFKDANGNEYPEWEDKKLLNVIAIQNGYAFKSNLFSEKGMPIIRITDINKSTVKKGTVYYPESIEINERFKIKQYDILIAMSGATTGKVGKYISEKPSLLNQRIGKFVMKKGTDNNFMFTYLNSLYFKKELSKLLVAGAQPNISSQDIENINLFIPINEEQRKIGEFFNELDELIEKQSSKIGVLKQRKKGFLQKMFV